MVKFVDCRTYSVMVVKGTARRPFPTNKFGCLCNEQKSSRVTPVPWADRDVRRYSVI